VASKTYIKESAKAIRRLQNSSHAGTWSVKVAFVFMIYSDLNFAKLWEEYFRAANPGSFKVLVHASEPEKAGQTLTPFFKERLVTGVPEGNWCHFSKTQLALIRIAFADEAATHIAWLSGDAVPLQRMEAISVPLAVPQIRSFFCVDHVSWARAEMWTILARPHALTITENEKLLFDLYKRYEACEDEAIFYEPLRLLGANEDALVDRCVMWTSWDRSTNLNFYQNTSHLLDVGSEMFGRSKFHPATFKRVPLKGMTDLLGSKRDFFFARKFAAGCEVEEKGQNKTKLADFLLRTLNLTVP